MSTINSVTAALGKDFEKLTGPDNYHEWTKAFIDICFIHGYMAHYNSTVDNPEKPDLPSYVAPRVTRSRSNVDLRTAVPVPISTNAANELAVYDRALQKWEKHDKAMRSAIALLRASVEPWIWRELDEEDTLDPHLAYSAIQLNNKASKDILVDRALTKLDNITMTDPAAIRPLLA